MPLIEHRLLGLASLLRTAILHDIVEGAERHHGRQAQKHHQLQTLRLDGPVDGLENLELVEEPLGLLP